MQSGNLAKIATILRKAKDYSNEVIEATVIEYVQLKTQVDFYYQGNLVKYQGKSDKTLLSYLEKQSFPVDIEFITEFFEALLEADNVVKNGILFTPEYIADYIC